MLFTGGKKSRWMKCFDLVWSTRVGTDSRPLVGPHLAQPPALTTVMSAACVIATILRSSPSKHGLGPSGAAASFMLHTSSQRGRRLTANTGASVRLPRHPGASAPTPRQTGSPSSVSQSPALDSGDGSSPFLPPLESRAAVVSTALSPAACRGSAPGCFGRAT